MDIGDWIIFRDMGAYTMAAASCFNGMPKPNCCYILSEQDWYATRTHTHTGSNEQHRLFCSVHSMLEKSLKMLEFGRKTSGPLKVLENSSKVHENPSKVLEFKSCKF